jgi:hypothetical protein
MLDDKEFVLSFSPIGAKGINAHSIVFNIDPVEDQKEIDTIRRLNEYFGILPSFRFSMRNAPGIFYEWQRVDVTEAKKENCIEFSDLRLTPLNLFEVRCQLLDNGISTGWLKKEELLGETWIKGGSGIHSFFMKLGLPDKNNQFPSAIVCLSTDNQEQVASFSKFIGDQPFARYSRKSVKGYFYEWTGIEDDSTYDHLLDSIGEDIFGLKIF